MLHIHVYASQFMLMFMFMIMWCMQCTHKVRSFDVFTDRYVELSAVAYLFELSFYIDSIGLPSYHPLGGLLPPLS